MNLPSLAARPMRAIRRVYRGYVVALLVFLSTGLSIGMTQYSFGEFAGPLQERYGWNQTQLNLSLTFAFISGILAPLIGIWTDRFGVRPVMFVSLILIAIGFSLRPFIYRTLALVHALRHSSTPASPAQPSCPLARWSDSGSRTRWDA